MRQRTNVGDESIATPQPEKTPADATTEERVKLADKQRGHPRGNQSLRESLKRSRWNAVSSNVIAGVFLIAVTGIVYALVQGLPGGGDAPATAESPAAADDQTHAGEASSEHPPLLANDEEPDLWPGDAAGPDLAEDLGDSGKDLQDGGSFSPPPLVGAMNQPANRDSSSSPTESWPPEMSTPHVAADAEAANDGPTTYVIPDSSPASETSRPPQSVPIFTWNSGGVEHDAVERPIEQPAEQLAEQPAASPSETAAPVQNWPVFAGEAPAVSTSPGDASQRVSPEAHRYPDTSSSYLPRMPSNYSDGAPPLRTGMRDQSYRNTPPGAVSSGAARLNGNVDIPEPRGEYERSRTSLH
jgi:hypothetical protein